MAQDHFLPCDQNAPGRPPRPPRHPHPVCTYPPSRLAWAEYFHQNEALQDFWEYRPSPWVRLAYRLLSTPISRYPGWLWLGKSLAKAHTASANLSVFEVKTVSSTRSDSKSDNNCFSWFSFIIIPPMEHLKSRHNELLFRFHLEWWGLLRPPCYTLSG